MHSHEVFKQLLKRVSAKQVAGELGLSLSLVYKWAEPPAEGSGAANPLDRIDSIIKLTGDASLAQWVCERSGGFFIKNPEPKAHPYELIPATNNIVQEFADLLAWLKQTLSEQVSDVRLSGRLIESPACLVTGMDSPVTSDSSSDDRPSRMTPSTGTFSPGRTRR